NVCRSSIAHLQTPSAQISSAGCNRHIWQHMIRYRLGPNNAKYRKWTRLAHDMHLVREDGCSWGST
ncbi:hypothetical protein LY76DRAFT_528334, partial [Colletotrichum caudatum]